jgi:alanine racemase
LQALVDLSALAHNLAQARLRAAGRPVWAVVKANAYGHGIENAVRAFAAADGLALLETDEAQRARAAGWRKPILLLEGMFAPRDLNLVEELDLTIVVHCVEQLAMLEQSSARRPVSVYLKIDTGMNRLGFAPAQVAMARSRLAALPQVHVAALMTHLANADREPPQGPSVAGQHAALHALAPDWQGAWSVSNSAALFLHAARGAESVRPGIALYGASPAAGVPAADLGLRAAMRLQARLLAIRELAPGECVGYGSLWRASRRSRIGVVACGYADGYPRTAPEGTSVWVSGQRVPLVGRVSMDMLTIDLTAFGALVARGPSAASAGSAAALPGPGSPVELWGPNIPVDELAERVGTVGYELLSGLPARVREAAAVDGNPA